MEIQNSAIIGNEPQGKKPISSSVIMENMDIQKYKTELEALENADISCTQKSEKSDTAEISPENSLHASEETETIRNIELLLAKLELWQPSINVSVDKNLAQLKELYMILLRQIIDFPLQHETQNKLLHILETHILGNIEKVAERNFHSLDSFFRQFGEKSDQVYLFNSLFKSVTGRTLHIDKIIRFLEKAQLPSNKGQLYTMKPMNENEPRGILYPRYSFEKSETYNSAFSNKKLVEADYWKDAALNHNRITKVTDFFSEELPKKDMLFQLHDLKISETFLKMFLDEGNIMKNPKITACNSQIKGFLAAVTWLKIHTFLQSSDVQKGLFSNISQAIDRMVDLYITKVSDHKHAASLMNFSKSNAEPLAGGKTSVYNIYYQIRTLFQSEENAGKALSSGLKYAYEQYMKSNKNEGFFFDHPASPKSDCRQGYLILKKDWKHFTGILPDSFKNRKKLDGAFLSPWGDYVSPLNPLYNLEVGNPKIIVGFVIAGIIIAIYLFT